MQVVKKLRWYISHCCYVNRLSPGGSLHEHWGRGCRWSTLDQSRGRKTDRGTRRSRRRGEEGATLVTVDQPFRHRTNQNQHPESGCWIYWFISDRSREITHSMLCNLLSGRSPTNQSTQVQAVGVSMYCFILLVSAARLSMAELNRRCTYRGFSSILNAALQKNFAGISSFTSQQFEASN